MSKNGSRLIEILSTLMQFNVYLGYIIESRFKHDVYGRRQMAKMTSGFVFFSSNP